MGALGVAVMAYQAYKSKRAGDQAKNSANDLRKAATSPFESRLSQGYLPPELRMGNTGPLLGAGVQGIGDLIKNPGGLSGNVADAIRPQLGLESQSIGQNFQNMQQQNAGNAARGNAPISIKNALSSALDTQQERAMRESRMGALTQSDQLRRQDLDQTYKLLDTILQFLSSGRGASIPGLTGAANISQQNSAAQMAALAAMMQSSSGSYSSYMNNGKGP